MTIEEVIQGFEEKSPDNPERDAYAYLLFQEAIQIGMEINAHYHTPEELRELMGRLTGKKVDDTFRLFPPFYTDFGKNITIGKDVFINSGCHFQDQAGITIGDGSLIGHNVVIAAINHDLNPENGHKNHYAPIRIGAHVWIGSNATILPFCTSHSSGIGSSAENLHELCPDSVNWLDGKRFEAGATKDAIKQWLDSSIE